MSDARDERRTDGDDLLAEIGAGLSIEPSAGFSAAVRRGVALGGARPRFSGAGWLQVVSLAAGVVVVVTLAMRFAPPGTGLISEPTAPGPVATRGAESPSHAGAALSAPTGPARVAMAPAARVRVARSGQASGVAQPEGPEVQSAGPDLVVLTNQPALLRRLWAGLPFGVVPAADADRASPSRPTDGETQIAITELTIAPIVIPDVIGQSAPVSGAGGAGVRRVISAEQSARSR